MLCNVFKGYILPKEAINFKAFFNGFIMQLGTYLGGSTVHSMECVHKVQFKKTIGFMLEGLIHVFVGLFCASEHLYPCGGEPPTIPVLGIFKMFW